MVNCATPSAMLWLVARLKFSGHVAIVSPIGTGITAFKKSEPSTIEHHNMHWQVAFGVLSGSRCALSKRFHVDCGSIHPTFRLSTRFACPPNQSSRQLIDLAHEQLALLFQHRSLLRCPTIIRHRFIRCTMFTFFFWFQFRCFFSGSIRHFLRRYQELFHMRRFFSCGNGVALSATIVCIAQYCLS